MPTELHTSPDLVSAKDAAEIAGVNRATITRWASNGILPEFTKVPGDLGARLFLRATVERVAAERTASKRRSDTDAA